MIDDTFDDANRNTSRSITLASGFVGTTSETRTYDALNRITVNQDNDYKLEYGYNKVHDRTYERYGGVGSAGDAFVYDNIRRLKTAYMGSTVPTAPAANPYVTKIDYPCDPRLGTTTATAPASSPRFGASRLRRPRTPPTP